MSRLLRRQTLASFDYQWTALPAGDAMLSDPWFIENAPQVIADQLVGVDRSWFRGRAVLDAGCGNGRWALGLLRLGARVLAVDWSPAALEATEQNARRLVPEAVAEGHLETMRVDLLAPPPSLMARRFDLVFSFGVLHHTGDTRRALGHIARLVAPGGVLFLYLYGAAALRWPRRLALAASRYALAPLPFPWKRSVLARLAPRRDVHQSFDLLSPLVNERYEAATVERWLRELDFTRIDRTLPHPDLFLRATREACSAQPFRAVPPRPYWFERYRRGGAPAAEGPH